MLNNLVESGSHKNEFVRKAPFFLGTVGVYAVLLLAASVASVYAYDAHLEKQNLEMIALISPSLADAPEEANITREQPRPKPVNDHERTNEIRNDGVARVDDARNTPKEITTTPTNSSPIAVNLPTTGGSKNVDVTGIGIPGSMSEHGTSNAERSSNNTTAKTNPPPPLPVSKPTPEPASKKKPIFSTVLTGKAISRYEPLYPQAAKEARASGTVTVQVVVDEQGKVVTAQAVSGHPLLRRVAEGAAYRWRFSPTFLTGQPVKVSGVITFNFTLQ